MKKKKSQIKLIGEITEQRSTFKVLNYLNHISIARLSRLLSIGASESLLIMSISLTDTTGSHDTTGTDLFYCILIKR